MASLLRKNHLKAVFTQLRFQRQSGFGVRIIAPGQIESGDQETPGARNALWIGRAGPRRGDGPALQNHPAGLCRPGFMYGGRAGGAVFGRQFQKKGIAFSKGFAFGPKSEAF